ETGVLQDLENQRQRRVSVDIDREILVVLLQSQNLHLTPGELEFVQPAILYREVDASGVEDGLPMKPGDRWQRAQIVPLQVPKGEASLQFVEQGLRTRIIRYGDTRPHRAVRRHSGRNVLDHPGAAAVLDDRRP